MVQQSRLLPEVSFRIHQEQFPTFYHYSQQVDPEERSIRRNIRSVNTKEVDFVEQLLTVATSEAIKYLSKNAKVPLLNSSSTPASKKIGQEEVKETTQVSTVGKQVAFLTGWLVWPFVVPFVVLIGAGIAAFIWYNFVK